MNIMDLKTISFLLTILGLILFVTVPTKIRIICNERWKKGEFTIQGIYLYFRLLFISGSSSVRGEKKESVCTSQGNQAPARVRHIIASHPLLWYIPQTLSSEIEIAQTLLKIFYKSFIPMSIIIPWTLNTQCGIFKKFFDIFAIAIAILSVQITFHSINFLLKHCTSWISEPIQH